LEDSTRTFRAVRMRPLRSAPFARPIGGERERWLRGASEDWRPQTCIVKLLNITPITMV
jgi:hypothetical protein